MCRKITFLTLFLSLFLFGYSQNTQFSISGTVRDAKSGEDLIGALVYVSGTNIGINSNAYGFYSLTLPAGEVKIKISYLGYQSQEKILILDKNIVLNVRMEPLSEKLDEFIVTSNYAEEQVKGTQMGQINIPIAQIKKLPTIGGEADILKVIQLLPGVKRGAEGQNSIMVRGGTGADNLILLDEAVVYNVSHLFGFFSVFNNSVIKDMSLYKGGFPAQYGGRLSSIMDIRMKEGNMQKYQVAGSIGLLSSSLSIEIPIIKNKMSFLASARRTYIDKLFDIAVGKNTLPYYFYDANFKLNYILSDKDRLFISTYLGDDIFKLSIEEEDGVENPLEVANTGFTIGNKTATARWNHVYNAKLFSNLSLIYTNFRYDIEASLPGTSFFTKSQIEDIGTKMDFNYYHKPGSMIQFGAQTTFHQFKPNTIQTTGLISDFLKDSEGETLSNLELGVFINHEYTIDSLWKINYGLRLSGLSTKGRFYPGIEPRATVSYQPSKNSSFKLNYARMYQYLFLITSSSLTLPTDLWYPATENLKPMFADQIAIGYNYNFEKIQTLITVEAYYKWMNNLIDMREGSVVFLKNDFEDQLITGKGTSYGVEVLVQKSLGKFSGWIGYTLSWSWRKFDELNGGKRFLAKYDRRHDLSIVASYDITKKISVSAVWVYATGNRFTPIIGSYIMPDPSLTGITVLPIYAEKNSYELPAAHRLDITVSIKSHLLKRYNYTGEWQFGAYNVYNQAQPYKVEIVQDESGNFKYQAKGLFGMIPFISYNFKF